MANAVFAADIVEQEEQKKKIIKQEINGKIVYLKETSDGFRIVNPLMNDESQFKLSYLFNSKLQRKKV